MSLDSILLVDDDAIAHRLHEKLISKLKLARTVFMKHNGKEALDFIKHRYHNSHTLPSLVILDLNMPVMDGVDFLKEICRSNLLYVNRIPIAILSNSAHATDMKKVAEIRNCFYATKPLTEEKLLQIVEHTCYGLLN